MTHSRRHFLATGAAGLAAAALPLSAARAVNWATVPFMAGDGREVSLADFIGRPIVLNFWATWCVPCRSEMPSLDALQASVGEAAFVVPVSVDQGGMAIIEQFYAQYELSHLGRYHDHQGALAEAFGVTAYPTSYLINSRGVVAGTYARPYDWNSTVAKMAVMALARG
ncbi:MAG: TlpA disulfide reductase family protein [Alphaproteobacteria bacterium]